MTVKGTRIRSTERSEDFHIKSIGTIDRVQRDFRDQLKDNNVKYKKIGNLENGKFYKYMDLETALICLESKTFRFVEPSTWQDNYESRFYNANYSNVLNGIDKTEVCPIAYSNCVTYKKNNEAAWKIYTYGKKGLGARCVEFTLNKSKLREQLITHLKDCTIYEGNVIYVWEGDIETLHQKKIKVNAKYEDNPWYDLFFSDFNLEKYLNLLLLKRDAFEHEKECRLMIIPNSSTIEKAKRHKKNGKTVYGTNLKINDSDVVFDWGQVIEEVRFDDSCTEVEIKLLREAVRKVVNFGGSDDEWEKDKRYPHCYHVYGVRNQIKIHKR